MDNPCGCEEQFRDITPCDMSAPVLPETGAFLIPLCVDRVGYQELIDALHIALDSLQDDDCRRVSVTNALAEFELGVSYVADPTLSPCLDVSERCYEFPPNAAFIEYYPNNPYTTPGLVPPGYTFPPWYIADTVASSVYDAEPGAAITSLERLPPSSIDFPRVRINLNGSGTAEFHLSALNTGGLVIVQVDADTLQTEIIDTHQDIVGVPPETENILIVEREFTTAGAHTVDLTFIPTVQDAIPPVLFGGGLFKVVLCGFDEVPEEIPMLFRQNDENPCLLEYSTDAGETWALAFDYSLCQPVCEGNDANNLIQYQQFQQTADIVSQQNQDAYVDFPSDIHPNAPDDAYNGDGSPERNLALCSALAGYVRWYAARQHQQISILGLGALIAIDLGAMLIPGLGWVFTSTSGVILSGVPILGGVSFAQMLDALTDEIALNEVTCCMYDALLGVGNSLGSWVDALIACGFTSGSNSQIVADIIAASLSANWFNFQVFLGNAYTQALVGDVFCPCAANWCRLWDGDNDFGDWAPYQSSTPDFTGEEWIASGYTSDGSTRQLVSLMKDLGTPTNLTRIQFDYELAKGTWDIDLACIAIVDYTSGSPVTLAVQSFTATPDTSLATFVWTGDIVAQVIRISLAASRGGVSGYAAIFNAQMEGVDDEPIDGITCP